MKKKMQEFYGSVKNVDQSDPSPTEEKRNEGMKVELERYKKLLRETVARCQIAFPVDEDMLQWFEEGTNANTESGRDFLIRIYEALEIGQDELIQPSPSPDKDC